MGQCHHYCCSLSLLIYRSPLGYLLAGISQLLGFMQKRPLSGKKPRQVVQASSRRAAAHPQLWDASVKWGAKQGSIRLGSFLALHLLSTCWWLSRPLSPCNRPSSKEPLLPAPRRRWLGHCAKVNIYVAGAFLPLLYNVGIFRLLWVCLFSLIRGSLYLGAEWGDYCRLGHAILNLLPL